MAFGYRFVDLNSEAQHARRQLLDRYALVAQFSILVVLAAFQLCFFASWLANRSIKHERPRNRQVWVSMLWQNWNRVTWWLSAPAIPDWTTRGQWVGGAVWAVWLLYLCVVQTGDDYLHLTKRFGAVGASQLPLHYLLAMRAPYSPIQYLARLSHEQLKPSHRILGNIIFLLFTLHTALYVNFFVRSGFLAKRIKDPNVTFGIISIVMFSAISTASLGVLRRRNYRAFYLAHVAFANLLIPPLYAHVRHIRPFIWEVIIINVLHSVFRARRLEVHPGTIKPIPGTDLVEVRVPSETLSPALAWRPGQHVYLGWALGRPHPPPIYSRLLLWRQTNPFTAASIPARDKELLLVARTRNGSTKKMAELARYLSGFGPIESPGISIALEGPYGAASRLPDLSAFDKVLLVAGGVGATFTLPIYRSIANVRSWGGVGEAGSARIRFIWAVRNLAETQWAFSALENEPKASGDAASYSSRAMEVFVTGSSRPNLHTGSPAEGIELVGNNGLRSMNDQTEDPKNEIILSFKRPNIPAIVDEVVSEATSAAIISCGPRALTEQLRRSVQQWVVQGHEVYWHSEDPRW